MSYDVDKAVREFESYLDSVLGEYPSGEHAWETILWGLRDQQSTLRNHGFVLCDNAECGCHSWHHRYGLAERFRELQDALREAGVLDSATGSRPIDGVRKLIKQRDAVQPALPEKKPIGDLHYGADPWVNTYNRGWNDCLAAIAGTSRGEGDK